MTRRLALVALWIAATAFAVLLASFAVRLAGDNVIAQGPVMVTRDEIEADLSSVPGTDPAPSTTAPPDSTTDTSTAVPEVPLEAAGTPPTTDLRAASNPNPTIAPTVDDRAATPDRIDDAGAPTTVASPVVPAAEPVASEQSFALLGGSVRVRCVEATASLVASSPSQGFAMEVRSSGPREVEVRFIGSDRTSELKASCAAGRVVAEPKESGGDDA